MRRWIVDASNVIGARPDGWWRDRPGALARLLDEITRWRAEVDEPVLVVADGSPTPLVPAGHWYGVELRYAGSRRRDAADDAIVEHLAAAPPASPGDRVVVVTSDRGLAARVEAQGAVVEGAGAFRRRIEDIEARRRDREVLDTFGIDESALLGRGGEARVYALDADRVLRLPHAASAESAAGLDERRALLDAIASTAAPVAVPEVLEHRTVAGRTVVIERRLPGERALDVLSRRGTDREALIRHHLDVAAAIAALPCPGDGFGERWGAGAVRAATFAEWSVARLGASLAAAGDLPGPVDAETITADLVASLPDPEPARPVLVHLDAYLGNMLAVGDAITAVLDFGPMVIGGPPDLDPLVAVAYLAPEITPGVTAADRAVGEQWADDHGLAAAVGPAERWIAAYWTGAPDDQRLRAWCHRILCDRPLTTGLRPQP